MKLSTRDILSNPPTRTTRNHRGAQTHLDTRTVSPVVLAQTIEEDNATQIERSESKTPPIVSNDSFLGDITLSALTMEESPQKGSTAAGEGGLSEREGCCRCGG